MSPPIDRPLLAEYAVGLDSYGGLEARLLPDERNLRSRRAIERLGARFDGVLRGHRVASDATVRNTAAYSIVAAEWPAVRANLEARLEGDRTA